MSKTVRIRTTPNGNDSYLKVKLEQDFDFIEILSLKISQAEAYARFCSDYGVVVGRVIVNNGFGIPNAKVSIFVPLTDEDEEDSEIAGLYPFKNIDDKDSEGIRYNLLQGTSNTSDECFTPVGTFPTKREVIDNDTSLEIYDKYYKFTTTTNDAGDFMLFGVPTGSHVLNVDVDLSDIGVASQKPYDYISEGESQKRFESPTKFKSDKDLDKLIQIKSFKKGVNVQPFWGDKEQCDIGISRVDVDLKKRIVPSAIFMGSLFSDSEKNSINKNCRPRKDFGRICETDTGEGTIEMIRRTLDGGIERFDVEGGRVINEFGSWAYQVPMNLDVMVTDEFGNLVPSDDPNKGLPTRARVRFRISKDISGDEGRLRTTAKYLVPHNPIGSSNLDYNFDENTSDAHFRDFHWNKIYSVSNFIPRVQTTCVGNCSDNRNMTGIKDVDDCSGIKNPFPYNRVDTDFNPLFSILCLIINIITLIIYLINSTVISFVNIFIKFLNLFLKGICEIIFAFAKVICGLIKVLTLGTFNKDNCLENGCITGQYNSSSNTCPCESTLPYVPCITLDCDGQVYAPGCDCNPSTINSSSAAIGSGDNNPNGIGVTQLGCWAARTNASNGKNIQHWSTFGNSCGNTNTTGHVGHGTVGAGFSDCQSIKLAEALNMFELDFYNDWVNGTLYTYMLKYKKKKRGKQKFCDADCGSSDSDNGCDKSWFVDTCVDGSDDRNSVKSVTKQYIDEGFIKQVTTRLPNGDEVENLYYAPYASKVSYKLFATELVHLGSVFDCDWQGIPKIQQFLVPTTYKRPSYTDEYLIDDNGNNTNIKTSCGMTSTGGNGSTGLFFDIDCRGLVVGQIGGLSRCDSLKRICEWGVNIDEAQLDSNNQPTVNADCYIDDNDLNQPYAGRVRDIFYSLNKNDGAGKLNSWSGIPYGINTGFGIGLSTGNLNSTTIGQEYRIFRGTTNGQPYWTPTTGIAGGGYVQSKNSYYFYFGTMPGQSALDLMNRKYFTTCYTPKSNDFSINLVSLNNPTAPSVCDGEINITVIGGNAPYTYNWTGPNGYSNTQVSPLTGDLTNLCGGNYTLTVTDANGGTSTVTYTLNEPATFSCSVIATDATSNGGNGTITINAFGGISPYSYSINGAPYITMVGSSTQIQKPSGVWVVDVKDGTGTLTCTNPTTGVTINEPPTLSIQGLTTWADTECGQDNGTITLALNSSIGGTPPYTINISSSNSASNSSPSTIVPFSSSFTNLNSLLPGTYNITISDSQLPTPQVDTDSVVIGPSTSPTISYNGGWYCWSHPVQSQNIYPSFTVTANGGFTITSRVLNNTNNIVNTSIPPITQTFLAGTTTAVMTTLHKDSRYEFELVDDEGCDITVSADFRPGEGHVPSAPQKIEYIPEDYCWVNTNPDILPKFQVWVDGPFIIKRGSTVVYTETIGVANGTIITLPTIQATSTSAVYELIETTNNCSVQTTPINFTLQHPTSQLTISIALDGTVGCAGTFQSPTTITATVSGGWDSSYTYKWYRDGNILGTANQGAATATPTVPSTDCDTVWTCKVIDDKGCEKLSSSVTII